MLSAWTSLPFLPQVMQEVQNFLKMLDEVYFIFGLQYTMALSTRPEEYLGEPEQWSKAEAALTQALNSNGRPWTLNEGAGEAGLLLLALQCLWLWCCGGWMGVQAVGQGSSGAGQQRQAAGAGAKELVAL